MKMKLTKSTIDNLKAKSKRYSVWDTQNPGFGVRVSTIGTKSFIFKYTNRYGASENMTIGKYGNITLHQAKEIVSKYRGAIANGGNPQKDKTLNRKAITIKELCDLYIKNGCYAKKASTLKTDKGRIKRHIKPLLGQNRVIEINRNVITKFFYDVKSGKTAVREKTMKRGFSVVTGGEGAAIKSKSLLGAMLTFAVNEGIIDKNPNHGLPLGKEKKLERYLSSDELSLFQRALENKEKSGGNIYPITALRLILLTGCRKGEICNLKWSEIDFKAQRLNLEDSEIDFKAQRLNLEDSKTGSKSVPLPKHALHIFNNLPKLKNCDYVFPGNNGKKPYQGLQKFWERLIKSAGIKDVRIHDLRHTFASISISNGTPLAVVGEILGHRDYRTTQRYAHIGQKTANDASDRTADLILKALEGK
ncbi:MAG: site-specific integrase [Hyphomicrobiales bacterium]